MNSTEQTPQKLELEFVLKLKNEILILPFSKDHKLIKSGIKYFYDIKNKRSSFELSINQKILIKVDLSMKKLKLFLTLIMFHRELYN